MAIFQNQSLQNERFSLLLLDPGEIYFEDFSAYYYLPSRNADDEHLNKQRGHLKVCSKSVVFVPKEKQFPLLKISLKNARDIEEYIGGLHSRIATKGKGLSISCDVCTEMKKDDVISPYIFKKGAARHIFTLNYVTVDDCLPLICQLQRASTLPPADQTAMITAIVMSRQFRVKFNKSWLDDLYEKIEVECQADKITPLVINPGRVLVTTSRLYFQPYNNVEKSPLIHMKLSDIESLIKRRFLLKQIGLEMMCYSYGTPQTHLYLAFKTEEDRDLLYKKIINQPDVKIKKPVQNDMTMKWQNGIISNFDYLMYINSAADRSFFDLTQYPIMPWVIQDYSSMQLDLDNPETFRDLSKPIGALSQDRLQRMKERYDDMPEPRFLYGTHYSTPGYVLFYLSRLVPEYVLCLQNGKFDQPDRMFNSMWDVWQNCLNGAADFKELIPEFFDGTGEFMINSGVCNFGVRQDGHPVENVDLPPWATDSKDCIKKMREALECEYVSKHLNEWIDLIFGYKQRGEDAEKADNVFYHLTYEGSVDLDSIEDPNERACLEIQIMEFGQVPKQLFITQHPVRYITKETTVHTEDLQQQTTLEQQSNNQVSDTNVVDGVLSQNLDYANLKQILKFALHKDSVTDVKLCPERKMAFSVSQDSLLKLYSIDEQRQLRSVPITSMALSSCCVMPDGNTVICGAWDNSVYFYSVEYGNIVDTLHAHDDAVSSVCWRKNLLITASWDSSVKLWNFHCPTTQKRFVSAEYFMQLDHDYGVSDIAIDQNCEILISGTREGQLYIWDLQKYVLNNVFQVHEGVINAVQLAQDCKKIICCGEDRYMRVVDVESGTEIFVRDIGEVVLCLTMVGTIVVLGTALGHIQIWDMDKVILLHQFLAHTGPVTCLHMAEDMSVLSGGKDRSVCLWKPGMK